MSLARFLAVAVLATVALAVVGCLLLPRVYGREAIEAALWASTVALFGSVVGVVPLAGGVQRGSPRGSAHAIAGASRFLAAMTLRLGAVALAALAVGFLAAPALEPFLLWLAACYLTLLVVDTGFALRAFRSL